MAASKAQVAREGAASAAAAFTGGTIGRREEVTGEAVPEKAAGHSPAMEVVRKRCGAPVRPAAHGDSALAKPHLRRARPANGRRAQARAQKLIVLVSESVWPVTIR